MAKPRLGDHIVYFVLDKEGKEVHADFDLDEAKSSLPVDGKLEKRIVNVTEEREKAQQRFSPLEKLVLGVKTKKLKVVEPEKSTEPEKQAEAA